MIINGKRALAYPVIVEEVKSIEGCDNIELARALGWWCIVNKKDNIKAGTKCIYFEIDSKVPSTDERFAFLEKRNYKIKTIKMRGVYSQGLLMPIELFPEISDKDIDVTDKLGVTYSVAEDNIRKSDNAIEISMKARHKKLFSNKFIKKLMKYKFTRKLLILIFGHKKDKPRGFPSFVSKTDEERIENMPWILNKSNTKYDVTEKLDGTSCTYALKRKSLNKFEFYVCSRNVRQKDEKQPCYHDHNIYWDLAFKYNIEEMLKDYLKKHKDCDWVCIQGEGVGSVQGNPLKLKEDDLYVFNFIDSVNGRYSSLIGRDIVGAYGIKWVPILDTDVTLPNNMEDIKLLADGKSVINPDVNREGLVYRSLDGKVSFKNVSRKYLEKHCN